MSIKTLIFDTFFPFLRQEIHRYINLCSNEPGTDIIIGHDNSLYTMIEISGAISIYEDNDFEPFVKRIIDSLKGNLREYGRNIQIVFSKDPAQADRILSPNINPLIETANKQQIDIGDILLSQKKLLSSRIHYEACYLIIQTSIDVIPPSIQSKMLDDRNKILEGKTSVKPGMYGQSPFLFIEKLFQSHKAFTDRVYATLSQFMILRKLTPHEALREIRFELHGDSTPTNWKPNLVGDPLNPQMFKENRGNDFSHILNQDLTDQLFTATPIVNAKDPTIIQYQDIHIAPFLIDHGPMEPKPFRDLFNSMPEKTPWRISILIKCGHTQTLQFIKNKKTIATLLVWSNNNNNDIVNAANEFIDATKANHVLARCYISATTWGKSLEAAQENKNILIQSITSWGDINTLNEKGNIALPWLETIPMMLKKTVSTGYPDVLEDIIKILPLTRPANIFTQGQLLLTTMCGKLYPFALFSEKQPYWVDIIFAKPGSGKSVLLSLKNIFLALSFPSSPLLPYVVTLDIGTSAVRQVEFLRDLLPEAKKNQSCAWRLRNTEDFAINGFDTPLGFRYQPSSSRNRLNALMAIILTPSENLYYETSDNKKTPELASLLVKSMYEYKVNICPEMYNPGINREIDKKLKELEIITNMNSTWWDIVDQLAELKEYELAICAQRYAVPNLTHASEVINNHDTFKALTSKEERDHLVRMITLSINDWPVLAGPTKFDIGNARFIAIDLEEVIPSSSDPMSIKQKNIFYLLPRFATTKMFYISDEFVDEAPDNYKAYHRQRLSLEKGLPKSFNVDEYHRTHGCHAFRKDCINDALTGRKLNIMLTILSQKPEHFDSDLIQCSSNKFILTNCDDDIKDFNYIKENFNLSKDEAAALKKHVLPPSSKGSNMMLISSTKSHGRVANVFRLPVCPEILWAVNNTKNDIVLYNAIRDATSGKDAINILTKHFKNGSAQDIINKRMKSAGIDDDNEDKASGLIIALAREILAKENIITTGFINQ